MKKSQFAIFIGVIVLCAGAIFGYVKYRLDKQEINNNSSVDNKNKNNKLYNLEEINDYLSNLSYNQTALMKKYNVSKKLVLRESESNSIFGVYINNNTKHELNPIYVPSGFSDGSQTINEALEYYSKEINDDSIVKYFDLMDMHYNLYELKDVNTSSNYLAILCDSSTNGGKVFIYDNNLNSVGNFDYMGSMYGIRYINNEENVIKSSGVKTIKIGNSNYYAEFSNIEFSDNSIIALEFIGSSQSQVKKVRYSINNGIFKRTVLEELELGQQIDCAGCK